MKIILLKDDKKLGKKNSIVEVKDGYGTFLIRQKIAEIASNSNISKLERNIQKANELDKESRELANNIKNVLENDTFIIDISYNKESQQLNGSITKNSILDEIKRKYPDYDVKSFKFIEFPKTRLAQLYKAKLSVYKDIVADIEFGVEL